jgi:hypothetical protein
VWIRFGCGLDSRIYGICWPPRQGNTWGWKGINLFHAIFKTTATTLHKWKELHSQLIHVEVKDLVKKRQISESLTLPTVFIITTSILSDCECLLTVCSKSATNNPVQNKTSQSQSIYIQQGHGSTVSWFLLHDHQTHNHSDASLLVPGIVCSPAYWQHSSVPPGQLYDVCQIFSPPSTGPAAAQGLNLLTDLHTQNVVAILMYILLY